MLQAQQNLVGTHVDNYRLTVSCLSIMPRVTAYPIKDDALKTGELDYINGGILATMIYPLS